MSILDQQFGERLGEMRGQATERSARARDNYAWQEYSNKLESHLNQVKSTELNEHVERKVAVDYVHALQKALKELAPDHPLLREDVAEKLFEESRIRAYSNRGYIHDPKKGTVKKA